MSLRKPNDEDMVPLTKDEFFGQIGTVSKTDGYYPPPWDIYEFPEKTEGWIEYQRAMRKDPQYYGPPVPNGVGYET